MYKVNGSTIDLTRGDTFIAQVEIFEVIDESTGETEPFTPQTGDKIRFALKKKYDDDNVLIEKDIPIDTLQLRIEPEDTKPLRFGDYVYDIELTTSAGIVDTFIHEALFRLRPEVV